MKKGYVRPIMVRESFVADEYVAACYHGVCNISGYVFTDTNGNGMYDETVDEYKYYNKRCGHDYWIQGQNSTLPDRNAFIFSSIIFFYTTQRMRMLIPAVLGIALLIANIVMYILFFGEAEG